MWVLLSRRIRTWLLLAVALPAARTVVHKLATAAGDRHPGAPSARLLGRADSVLTRLTRRARPTRGR